MEIYLQARTISIVQARCAWHADPIGTLIPPTRFRTIMSPPLKPLEARTSHPDPRHRICQGAKHSSPINSVYLNLNDYFPCVGLVEISRHSVSNTLENG